MVGFPYDDLEGWRSVYPEDVFETQFKKLTDRWQEGLEMLPPDGDKLFCDCARSAYLTFKSTYNMIVFVRLRSDISKNRAVLLEIIENERRLVNQMLEIVRSNSLIGYAASNHYMFTDRTLSEKLINLEYCEAEIKRI